MAVEIRLPETIVASGNNGITATELAKKCGADARLIGEPC